MQSRCDHPLPRYQELNISMDDRWRDFKLFLKDMGERPEGCTLERKDNTRGYYPGNVIWATPKQQARNRRNTPMITYQDKTQSIASWAEELGHNYYTLRARLVNYDWDIETALTTPTRSNVGGKYVYV